MSTFRRTHITGAIERDFATLDAEAFVYSQMTKGHIFNATGDTLRVEFLNTRRQLRTAAEFYLPGIERIIQTMPKISTMTAGAFSKFWARAIEAGKRAAAVQRPLERPTTATAHNVTGEPTKTAHGLEWRDNPLYG